MPWIRFNERFDYTVKNRRGQPTTVYQPGMVEFVTRARAEAAIASGKGEATDNPKKGKKTVATDRPDAGTDSVR